MPDKVFFNSACPVCNAGIKAQRQRMETCGVTDLEWIDVHTSPETVQELGASLKQVRERLFVKDSNGQLMIGADAFAYLWGRTRGQRWLAKLVRSPVLRKPTRLVYNTFARVLYRWNRNRGHW